MSQTTLSLAQQALHSPHGTAGALSLLEQQVVRNEQVAGDATVWACIAHLRKKTGDDDGAEEATRRARHLADARGMEPRRLSFGERIDDAVKNGANLTALKSSSVIGQRKKMEGKEDGSRDRCEQILNEMITRKKDNCRQDKVHRLVARSKWLKTVSEVLLRRDEPLEYSVDIP